MKKCLLSFLMLMLSIAFLPKESFAQELPGGASDGYVDQGTGTPAVNFPSAPPPNFVLTLKRNNGNGHCLGSATATINFKGAAPAWMQLIDIATLADRKPLTGVIVNSDGRWNKSALEYCLAYNIAPKNKLIFHFRWAGGDFWIPEL
jgi:hypothetical protein